MQADNDEEELDDDFLSNAGPKMSEEEKKILLQKYHEEGEGEEEVDEEEEEEEEDQAEGGEEEEDGDNERETEREREGEGDEDEGEGGRNDDEEEDDDNENGNEEENSITYNSKKMIENENILLKRITESKMKNLKKANTELSNDKTVIDVYTENSNDSQRSPVKGTKKTEENEIENQIPQPRQYGNKKKFVITSPEKFEAVKIVENQRRGT